jgi:glycerol-3-phosphate O-acyltransferase / dihydroxyacetone phosphate acyltransferase
MNLVKKIIYHSLKSLVVIGFRVYFKKIVIINPERKNIKGPFIANCNHPATVLDPFSSAFTIPRYFHFLANIGLFRKKIWAGVLHYLFCIPIERHLDMKGKPLHNEDNFEAAIQLLSSGGCLHITPEGFSIVERRMRKIRTGTARIALQTEARNDFKLGLIIQPAGLNYSDPIHFRTEHLIILGEPIRIASFKDDYQKDPRQAVRTLTDTLRQRLTDISIVTGDDDEDQLLLCLEDIQRTENPLGMEAHFYRTKELQAGLRKWKEDAPKEFAAFEGMVRDYATKLRSLRTSDAALKNPAIASDLLPLVPALPFFVLGYASHFLCCWLAQKSSDWFNDTYAFIPTYKFVTGLITFPLFYALQIWLVHWLTCSEAWTVAYALSIVPTGLVADWFLNRWQLFVQKWKVKAFARKDSEAYASFLRERENISGIPSFPKWGMSFF